MKEFTISADDLKILSYKLTFLHVTELDLCDSRGLTGSLSVLFTHSLPTLNTLIMHDLNSYDVQSLAKAGAEGKITSADEFGHWRER